MKGFVTLRPPHVVENESRILSGARFDPVSFIVHSGGSRRAKIAAAFAATLC
jgi:hypothetical protein